MRIIPKKLELIYEERDKFPHPFEAFFPEQSQLIEEYLKPSTLGKPFSINFPKGLDVLGYVKGLLADVELCGYSYIKIGLKGGECTSHYNLVEDSLIPNKLKVLEEINLRYKVFSTLNKTRKETATKSLELTTMKKIAEVFKSHSLDVRFEFTVFPDQWKLEFNQKGQWVPIEAYIQKITDDGDVLDSVLDLYNEASTKVSEVLNVEFFKALNQTIDDLDRKTKCEFLSGVAEDVFPDAIWAGLGSPNKELFGSDELLEYAVVKTKTSLVVEVPHFKVDDLFNHKDKGLGILANHPNALMIIEGVYMKEEEINKLKDVLATGVISFFDDDLTFNACGTPLTNKIIISLPSDQLDLMTIRGRQMRELLQTPSTHWCSPTVDHTPFILGSVKHWVANHLHLDPNAPSSIVDKLIEVLIEKSEENTRISTHIELLSPIISDLTLDPNEEVLRAVLAKHTAPKRETQTISHYY